MVKYAIAFFIMEAIFRVRSLYSAQITNRIYMISTP